MTSKIVLVVVAHPDDEVLGCGATIAKHCNEGDEVNVMFLSDGVGARVPDNLEKEIKSRKKAAETACKKLGVRKLSFHSCPDNRMDQVAMLDVVQLIEGEISKYKPSVIYTHHSGDVNIDHRVVHNAVVTACRPQPGFCVRQLLFFETLSSTEWMPTASLQCFSPNWFIDVSDYLSIKQEALDAYEIELRAFPHPRSIETISYLAHWRGSMIGVNAAEAFELGRFIN
jgi:N-acetylglucosamine malate deacetylase 1